METVGFIGLGIMGSGMAANIQKAGYPLVVYDVREEATRPFLDKGARLAGSPAEVARLSDVVFTSLPGPKEVEEVASGSEGLLQGIKEGGVYIDLSTSSPTLIRQLEPKFRTKGAYVLDAPVSGGKKGADSGTLAVIVGGDPEVYNRVKPMLDTIGDKAFYAGTIGAGSICKLVHEMIAHSVREAFAEGFTVGVKAGVDPESIWECVRRGGVGRLRDIHEGFPRTVFKGSFEPPSFALKLARKDIGLAVELAHEYDVPIPIAELAERRKVQAVERGWGDKDDQITFLLQEELAGVQVRAPDLVP